MSVISIFSGNFCRNGDVVRDVIASTGYQLVGDRQIVTRAGRISGIPEEKIRHAFGARTSVFNKFTREKECSVAYLKLALAELLAEDNLLVSGFSSQLIPPAITHVLHVCLIADTSSRVDLAVETKGVSPKDALKAIRQGDEDRAAWVGFVRGEQDPWAPSLYDLLIPMNKTSVERAGALIEENVLKDVIRTTDASRQAATDFRLAAGAEVALAREGHSVEVSADAGAVTLTINRHVLMLSRLEEEIKSIVEKVPGVASVETRVGKDYHQSNIYRRHDFSVPSKVLLVDDEKELVQTLSERLLLRDMGSAVAFDGQSALDMVTDDEPEVMIIDLKMPGIDGMEVLKKVKQSRPQIEVIILTGHGSEADRELCMRLGAFGYLQKPVDIELLSEMLKKAHQKIRQGKEA